MNEIFFPGQAIIEAASIISADGSKTINITNQIAVIELYEDISKPYLTASVTIVDMVGLTDLLPLTGLELLTLKFKPVIPEIKSTEVALRVHELQGVTNLQHKKTQAYVLKCTDIDVLQYSSVIISKGYDALCSDIVKDIVSNVMKSEVKLEPTKGKQKFVIPSVNAYQAIDFVRRKATSASYDYSPYAFFRTIKDGFFFATFAYLVQSGTGKPVRKFDRVNLLIDEKEIANPYIEYNNILAVSIPRKFKNAAKTESGAFASYTDSFDIVTKKISNNNFTLANSKFARISGPYKAYASAQTKSAVGHFIVTDSSKPETYELTTLGEKRSFVSSLLEDTVVIDIHGDNQLSVGDIVEVRLPVLDGLSYDEIKSDQYNGEYLITKVKHVVQVDTQTRYKTTLTLIRNSKVYE